MDLVECAPSELCKQFLASSFSSVQGHEKWPLQLKMLMDDEAVSAGEKLQHQLWDRMEKLVIDGWCTDLEQALYGKWILSF